MCWLDEIWTFDLFCCCRYRLSDFKDIWHTHSDYLYSFSGFLVPTHTQFLFDILFQNMAQLMLLPLTVSCFSKIQIGVTFLVLAHPGSPGQKAVKWVLLLSFPESLHGGWWASSPNENVWEWNAWTGFPGADKNWLQPGKTMLFLDWQTNSLEKYATSSVGYNTSFSLTPV